MATINPETRALYTRLQEVLGNEHANTLMTYLPVEPGTHLATKSEIDARFDRLEKLLDLRFDSVDQRFEQVDQRFEQVDQRFASMETRLDRMDGRFETMDDRMYGLQDVIRDQLKTYTITMVGSMTALTAIFAALLTIIT